MSDLKVLSVAELPGDRLEITYTDGEPDVMPSGERGRRAGRRLIAWGWASALRNYYEPAAYAESGPCDHCETDAPDGKGGLQTVKLDHQPGDRHLDAKPREMSNGEIGAYALALAEADYASHQPAARTVRWQP